MAFGIDSAQIEEAIGMPVVNMGLHGALGNAFHENMAKLGVLEGDIVILCHTSFCDDDTILNAPLAWITIEMHKELWPLIRPKDMLKMAWAYPDYFKHAFIWWAQGSTNNTPDDTTCYSRSAFNEYGDIDRRFDANYTFTAGSVVVPQINDTCMKRINELNKYIEEKGATLLIAGYPIGYGEFTPSASEYDTFEAELREKAECDVISHYTDYFIPYNFFYDTEYHLSEEGVDIRTKQLIEDLDHWMNKDQD